MKFGYFDDQNKEYVTPEGGAFSLEGNCFFS